MIRFRRSAILVTLALAGACSGNPEPQQPEVLSVDELYGRAMKLLADKKWDEAETAFERLSLEYPADPRAQEAHYRMGEAYMGKKEYVTAANEFARLAADYPSSPWADDARFKVCEAYYKLSPDVQLDQQYTESAIDHCESLIGYYPDSEFVPKAREIVKELSEKLAQKMLIAGQYYMRRKAYDSALIYFENTVKLWPETETAPRALLLTIEAYRALNYKEEMDAARERLLKDYPNSPEAKQAKQQDASVAKTS